MDPPQEGGIEGRQRSDPDTGTGGGRHGESMWEGGVGKRGSRGFHDFAGDEKRGSFDWCAWAEAPPSS